MRQTPILPLVISDITDRIERRGRQTYGRDMTTCDGRDSLVEAYEEALDLCCYLRKEIEERRIARERFHAPVNGLAAVAAGIPLGPAKCEYCGRQQCLC